MTRHTADNTDSKERFSSRVDAYREFRPRYPLEVIDLLRRQCGLTPASIVADIGAGTGMLAEIFLEHGNSVFAVEPNRAMRSACEDLGSHYPKLTCIDASAEDTTLPDHWVDFVTVGQALHWFHLERARAEFVRILREFGADYESVRSKYPHQQKLAEFFTSQHAATPAMPRASIPNAQEFDLRGLVGRILSSSYMPQPNHPRYPAMIRAIEELFSQCRQDGRVRLDYDCVLTCGQIA